ncbi:MAG TPA: hypothetical protein VMW81_04885 [Nitrospinota bacterium]|nr:hypothetical protein [Nitrospinota bacterium]
MTDEMKSALEIAMEKLKKMGEQTDENISLTEKQKNMIADIKKEYDAKIAEKEIMMQSKIKELAYQGEPIEVREQTEFLQKEFAEEKIRLEQEKNKKIEEIRKKPR